MSEPINNGELLLPVCIPEEEIGDLFSALDLYRKLRKGGQTYAALEAVANAVEFLDNPQDSPCLDIEGSEDGFCWAVDTTSAAIRFYPNGPFDPVPETRPTIGQWERWQVAVERLPNWADAILDLAENQTAFNRNIGYFPNDAFVVAPDENTNDVLQFFNSLNAIRKADFPYIEIELQGTGELELHLLQVPFGGSAIIVWDMEFDVYAYLWDLVNGGSLPSGNIIQTELEREIATFPPESNEENVIEIDFAEDTDHIVRVYFVPRIDYTALDFLGNGGGIREVSACGDLALKTEDGDLITQKTYRLDEFTKGNFIMATIAEICEGMVCAFEKMAQRILLAQQSDNILGGISVDHETGEVSKSPFNTSIVKPVSGITPEESQNGSVYHVAQSIAELFADIATHEGNGFTNDLIASVTQVAVAVVSPVTWLSFITDYIASAENIVINVDALAEQLYCNNFNIGFVKYLIDNHTQAEIAILTAFVAEIDNSQITQWYQEGKNNPLSFYQGYACFRRPDVEFTYTAANYSARFALYEPLADWNFAEKRAIRITLSGRFTSISEPLKQNDIFYETDNTGEHTLALSRFRFRMSPSNENLRDVTPEVSETGDYVFTAVIEANNHTSIELTNQGNPPYISDPEGEITVLVQDLGAI